MYELPSFHRNGGFLLRVDFAEPTPRGGFSVSASWESLKRNSHEENRGIRKAGQREICVK